MEREKEKERESKAELKRSSWNWEPEFRGYPLKAKERESRKEGSSGSLPSVYGVAGSMTEACVEPGWRVNDIPLAAKVLGRVSASPTYSDEAEMRRVFGLVYDVFRCKLALLAFQAENAASVLPNVCSVFCSL